MNNRNHKTIMGLCRQIKHRREELGQTPDQLAIQIGIRTNGYVEFIEKGRRSPPMYLLPRIARALRFAERQYCLMWLKCLEPEFYKAVVARD
jgi:transcriptional regulator with XRE-family HTH domain